MRVAIIHSWFLSSGGAEATVDALAQIFPSADFFALFVDEGHLTASLRGRTVKTLGLDWLPAKYSFYRQLLAFYPFMFERFDLRGYDLVITSDSSVAKCIITDQETVHICYCYSPMRCLYDQYREYLNTFPVGIRSIFALAAHYVRALDFIAAQRVTLMIGDSYHIARRIKKYYGCHSEVIYAPVNTSSGYIAQQTGDYYLSVGRLTTGKHVDLIINACNRLGKRLLIVGSGREKEKLVEMAGPTIEFAGRLSDAELSKAYAECKALLFSANEDFGIVPVEAQSYGRPVIAFGQGGCLETVIDMETGLFFFEQTEESLMGAIERFEAIEGTFDPNRIQELARRFDTTVFKQQILRTVQTLMTNAESGDPELYTAGTA